MREQFRYLSVVVLPLVALTAASPLAAQSAAVSQPVVQPLPPPQVESLDEALRRLAHHPRDIDALIAAGNASLQLNDVEAAIGFFNRAQEVAPGDPRSKFGLAGAYVRSDRPIEALALYREAAAGGANESAIASDRGLAYDLVGDNAAAQAQYRVALAQGDDEEATRRLALSLAIAGDREGFEKALYPLLAKQDFAGFRARAFGLAILGQEEEAVAIAEAVMSPDLAARIAPYLRYMRRLTKAQQAAAANLGAFPRAAQIGRDDPRIAAYSGSSLAARGPDARLAPSGTTLGQRSKAESDAPRRRPDRGSSTVAATPGNAGSRPFDQRNRIVPQQGQQVASASAASTPTPTPTPAKAGELPPVGRETSAQSVAVSRPVVQQLPPSAPTSTASGELAATEGAKAGTSPADAVRVVDAGAAARPTIDLAEPAPAQSSPATSASASAAAPPPVAEPPPSVADAFAGFTLARSTKAAPAAGAVDITAIKPPREVEEKPPEKPAPPKHPSRFWVQVATGKDLDALKWDWRRISRKAPEILGDFEPMTTPWVEANRLLAGPYKTEKAADEAVSALRKAGLDSFEFTSDEGQAIVPLD